MNLITEKDKVVSSQHMEFSHRLIMDVEIDVS